MATLLLAAIVAAPTTFRIDPDRAEAGFDLKATMHTVHGTTHRVGGEVRCVPEDGGALTFSGVIEVDAASLDTDNDKRDAKMHGTTLEVARFPKITLEPDRFTPATPPGSGGTLAGRLTGALTIRGTTHPTTIDATITVSPDGIDVEGKFDVAWAEFGIPDPSFFVVRIDKVAHARFRARFVAQP
jgi:polyisoprenoid-binding protein YceI